MLWPRFESEAARRPGLVSSGLRSYGRTSTSSFALPGVLCLRNVFIIQSPLTNTPI